MTRNDTFGHKMVDGIVAHNKRKATKQNDSMLDAITGNRSNKVLPEPVKLGGVSYGIYDTTGHCSMSGQASSYTEALTAIEEFINDNDISMVARIGIVAI